MRAFTAVRSLPRVPAIYVLHSKESGGRGRQAYAAYVGLATDLNQRVVQHLWRQDSSATTGTSAVHLNPEYITEVCWWEHPYFAMEGGLEAAEQVAAELLKPVMRSRGKVPAKAKALLADENFMVGLTTLFAGDPAGRIALPSLEDLLDRLEVLEGRVATLERRLDGEA